MKGKRLTLIFFILLTWLAPARAAVLFEETFVKAASGQLEETRTFGGSPEPAVITFTNGGDETFDLIKLGKVSLNDQPLFGHADFKINGSIVKTVVLASVNTLRVELSGPAGGQAKITITQGPDPIPELPFPAGTIFVSAQSIDGIDDTSCGTSRRSPCRTIAFALNRARAMASPMVAVAGGFYNESIVLVPGVSLMGGYDDAFSMRHIPTLRAILRGVGTSEPTVSAIGINAPTLFEGFMVLGPVATVPSRNSIAILVRDSAALTIQNNVILGGVGAAGARASMAASGAHGVPGLPGWAGGTTAKPGGDGGVLFASAQNVSGGRGGNSGTPDFEVRAAGASGLPGFGTSPGPGGLAGMGMRFQEGFPCTTVSLPSTGSVDGAHGGNGADGSHGSGGAGGSHGSLASGRWISSSGSQGTAGSNGSGGGGGGAGGGTQASSTCAAVFGSSGGGGGSGGGTGSGGLGGAGGGAAFGILVLSSDGSARTVIGANEIYLGVGAPGGAGGTGGSGGLGATGGAAGGPVFGSGLAGRGGDGGDGGHGGGGGGGAGGSSFGIAANFDPTPYASTNFIVAATGSAGPGGEGGASFGNAGNPGQPGQVMPAIMLAP